MAELTNERFMQLQQLADQYTRSGRGYEAADLTAAGFSPAEVAEFDAVTRQNLPEYTGQMPDPTFASAREPTRRERHAATLAEFFGGENADRGDYRQALKFTGTTDPSATFADQMGLADLTPLSALYGIEEGADTAARGYQTGDLGTMAMGGLEAGLGILEALPGAGAVYKGIGKALDARRGAPPAPSSAVIRRDDVFRGSGPATVSYPRDTTDPFAVRLTDMNQLQDMVESGLVRPKPGGYGRGQKSSLYFGTSQNPDPTASVFSSPSERKPVVLVGDAQRLASFEDGIPIDALTSILVRQQDGTLTDMFDEIIRQNRGFGQNP